MLCCSQKKAIEKLRNKSGVVEIKNPNPNRSMIGLVEKVACNTKMKKLVEERVKLNRKDLTLQNKENVERDVSGTNNKITKAAINIYLHDMAHQPFTVAIIKFIVLVDICVKINIYFSFIQIEDE